MSAESRPPVGSLWTDVDTFMAEDTPRVYVVIDKTDVKPYAAECYIVSSDGTEEGYPSVDSVHLSWFAQATVTIKTFTRLV